MTWTIEDRALGFEPSMTRRDLDSVSAMMAIIMAASLLWPHASAPRAQLLSTRDLGQTAFEVASVRTITEPQRFTISQSLPSISTVVQEDLGLRLDSRTVPVEKLVIDSVEHPTDN